MSFRRLPRGQLQTAQFCNVPDNHYMPVIVVIWTPVKRQ